MNYKPNKDELDAPARPQVRSNENMRVWQLKINQWTMKKGLGEALGLADMEVADMTEKQRKIVFTLCAEILDDVKGPLRQEPELVLHLLEATQDQEHGQHGSRVIELLKDGYALTDDSVQYRQLSKIQLTELLKIRFTKTSTLKDIKTHLDAIIAQVHNLGGDYYSVVDFYEHLILITPPDSGTRSQASWDRHITHHVRAVGDVTSHKMLRDIYAEWWNADERARALHDVLRPLEASATKLYPQTRETSYGAHESAVGEVGELSGLQSAMKMVAMAAATAGVSAEELLEDEMEAMRVTREPCSHCGLNHPGGLRQCYGMPDVRRDPAHIEAMRRNAPERLRYLDELVAWQRGERALRPTQPPPPPRTRDAGRGGSERTANAATTLDSREDELDAKLSEVKELMIGIQRVQAEGHAREREADVAQLNDFERVEGYGEYERFGCPVTNEEDDWEAWANDADEQYDPYGRFHATHGSRGGGKGVGRGYGGGRGSGGGRGGGRSDWRTRVARQLNPTGVGLMKAGSERGLFTPVPPHLLTRASEATPSVSGGRALTTANVGSLARQRGHAIDDEDAGPRVMTGGRGHLQAGTPDTNASAATTAGSGRLSTSSGVPTTGEIPMMPSWPTQAREGRGE